MTQQLKYLHHPSSQPCRAVQQFMLETNIPYEEEIVDILNGVNETPEFKSRYNPTGQIPILCDGDFVVWESAAIAYYLNAKFEPARHWFGDSLQQQARIQQYLHWHSTTLRRGAGAFFYTHFAECIWGKHDYSAEIDKGRFVLGESMGIMDKWLGESTYLCGEEISYADLQGFHEFVSHTAGAIISADQWERHLNLKRWFDQLMERPHAKTVTTTIMQIGEMRQAGEPIPMQRRTSLAKGTEIVGAGTVGIPYFND
ncbi:MAG: glutathione S-transferase family protein [Pseudomonadota bacterium]